MKRWWWFVGSVVVALSVTGLALWLYRGDRGEANRARTGGGSILMSSDSADSAEGVTMDLNSATNTAVSMGDAGNGSDAPVSGKASGNDDGQKLTVGTSSSGQLSQGVAQNTTESDNATPKSAPEPAEFGQYDKYKAEQAAYTGDFVLGTGAEASSGKWLTMQYRGWLTNGTLFDASYDRGQPFTFQLGAHQVIAGWEQGIFGMKVGGKRRLIVPPVVGYGTQGQGPIPPNSVLVFDVELVGVHDSKPTP